MTNEAGTGTDDKGSELIIYDFNPHNIPSAYLQAIGLVALASSHTEDILQEFIGALLGIDNMQALALTLHMNFPLKDNIIRALAELEAPNLDELDKVDELLDAVNEAMDKRNAIIHNSLSRHPVTGQVYSHKLTARKSLRLDLKPISVEEIKKDADFIYEVGLDIVKYMIAAGLSSSMRTGPLRKPPNRKKSARAKRRKD